MKFTDEGIEFSSWRSYYLIATAGFVGVLGVAWLVAQALRQACGA